MSKLSEDIFASYNFDPESSKVYKSDHSPTSKNSNENNVSYSKPKLESRMSHFDVVKHVNLLESSANRGPFSSADAYDRLNFEETVNLLLLKLKKEERLEQVDSPTSPKSGLMQKRLKFKSERCFSEGSFNDAVLLKALDMNILQRQIANYENGKISIISK